MGRCLGKGPRCHRVEATRVPICGQAEKQKYLTQWNTILLTEEGNSGTPYNMTGQ